MRNKVLIFNTYEKKKRDDFMCRILRNLQGRTAQEIIEIYGNDELPVDMESIAKRIGIQVMPVDFTDIEESVELAPGTILGATVADGEKVCIYYRGSDCDNRKKFTIAHEIAHCCLHTDTLIEQHIELRGNETNQYGREYEANVFAGELLISESKLKEICKRLLVPALSALCDIFEVSANVMAARLDYLKMPYYKDREIKEV